MRHLRTEEVPLFSALLNCAGASVDLDSVLVEDLDDGGMGSVRIAAEGGSRRFARNAAECEFDDIDSVTVTAALYLDQEGEPFEFDVWKVDFSPLRRWPVLESLRNLRPNNSLERSRDR